MFDWWKELTFIQQIFGLIAIPSTVILIIQTILVMIGVGEVEGDVDIDGDAGDISGGAESANGFALFSLRGIIAFLAVGGWTGVVLDSFGAHIAITITVSLLAGAIALIGVALLMKMTARLQEKGNIVLSNAVGKTAKVYITVPETGITGKVTLTLQGRFTECDAMTKAGKALLPGQLVRVIGTADENTLIVEEANNET